MATAQRATLHGTGVMPSLTVNRLDESLNFFSRLGFRSRKTSGKRAERSSARCSKPETLSSV